MQKITVVTDGTTELTKANAVESLGSDAGKYVVVTWQKEGEEEASEEMKKPELDSNLLAESQEWTNKKGNTITAAVQKVEGGKVFFLMNGKVYPVPVADLSEETVSRLKELMTKE